jgi:hypothetical protein
MTISVWPISLPQVPQKGYTESLGLNIIRSQPDLGPSKQRRRGVSPNTMDVNFILTTEQAGTLESFLLTELQGVKRFKFNHPRTLQDVEVRAINQSGSLYKLQYLAPGYWTASLQLEILP